MTSFIVYINNTVIIFFYEKNVSHVKTGYKIMASMKYFVIRFEIHCIVIILPTEHKYR
jgi:hypothetical protein